MRSSSKLPKIKTNMSIQPIYIESKELSLPMTITFDVNFKDKKDSVHLWFSQSKKNWGQVGCDGLVASFSSSRADFTYRSDGYKVSNPSLTVQNHETFLAEPNKTYRFKSVITDSFAQYYINEKLYASANFPPGTVPSKGYFGFATDHDHFRSFVSNENFMRANVEFMQMYRLHTLQHVSVTTIPQHMWRNCSLRRNLHNSLRRNQHRGRRYSV